MYLSSFIYRIKPKWESILLAISKNYYYYLILSTSINQQSDGPTKRSLYSILDVFIDLDLGAGTH